MFVFIDAKFETWAKLGNMFFFSEITPEFDCLFLSVLLELSVPLNALLSLLVHRAHPFTLR